MSDSHLLSPPSLFPQSNQTSWSAGVLQSSQQLHSSLYPMSASSSTPSSVPFSSSSLLSNQDAHSYRSVTVAPQTAINQHDNAWMNDGSNDAHMQQQGFDSWGVTHKTGGYHAAAPTSYYAAPQKELNIAPHMQTVVVNSTAAPATSESLPRLPAFVEFSSFSVPHASLSVCDMWSKLEDHLLAEGIIVGETKEKQYQLLCFAPTGGKSTEFIVRCYAGHFREADPCSSPVSEPHYTVEFQRRVGCCMGFVEIFRSAIRALSEVDGKTINIDSRITASDNPCQMLNASNCSQSQIQSAATNMDSESDVAAQIEHVDLSDCDLTQLAIPSLAASRANTGIDDASAASITQPPAALTADDSLYDSLCDLIASDDGPTQLEGLNALSLCLDPTQPRACEALKQVANKLRSGRCERIKQAAARVILQAAAAPQSSASNVIQACLPAVLAQLAQCSAAVTSNGAPYPTAAPHCPLAGACATQTQKCLLRSCLQLAACPQFQGVLDQEGSAVAFSTLKRQLLRMTDSPDEEVRGLAKQTIRALSV